MFKATFYFAVRAEDFIKQSDLPLTLINQFTEGKAYGKIKGITLEVRTFSDLENVRKLLTLKETFK